MTEPIFPNGHEPDTTREARLAEAVRKAAQDTTPDPEFVAQLEAKLRQQAIYAEPQEAAPKKRHINLQTNTTSMEEILTMQMQESLPRRRDNHLIPIPLAAALTALIAVGALMLMMNLYPRPNPVTDVAAGLIQGTATPTATVTPLPVLRQTETAIREAAAIRLTAAPSATLYPDGMATYIIRDITQTADYARLIASSPPLQTAMAIIAEATGSAMPSFPQQTATERAYRDHFSTERAIIVATGERRVFQATANSQAGSTATAFFATQTANLVQATPTLEISGLSLTATAIVGNATPTLSPEIYATYFSAPATQTAEFANLIEINPPLQTAMAIIAGATASAMPSIAEQTATTAAQWEAYATEVGGRTLTPSVPGTREAILANYTATSESGLEMTATAIVAQATASATAPMYIPLAPVLLQGLGDGVRLRLTPDVNGDVVGTINQGTWFVVTGHMGPWIQIEYADSPNGYAWVVADLADVQGDLSNVEHIPSAFVPVLLQGLGNDVRLRLTPDVTGDALSTINQGTWFVVTGRTGSWIQIEYADSPSGYAWVFAELVDVQGDLSNVPELPTPFPIPVGGWTNDFSDSAIRVMRTNGMTWVVLPIPYHLLTDNSNPMIPVTKALITTAHENGFKVLLNLYGNPADFGSDYESYVEAFATFAGELAALSPNAIQVWNEPNIDNSWTTDEIDAAAYVQMLEAAFTAIKAANPDVMVITAAPAPTTAQNEFPGHVVNDDVYYQDMAAAGAGAYADCIGVQYVLGAVAPTETSGDPRGEDAIYYLVPMLQRAAEPFRESGLPLCVTSLGYASFENVTLNQHTPDDLYAAMAWARETSLEEKTEWTQQAIQTLASLSSIRVEMVMVYRVDPFGDLISGLYAVMRGTNQ